MTLYNYLAATSPDFSYAIVTGVCEVPVYMTEDGQCGALNSGVVYDINNS
ncbi:MAG: hypothetical protein H6765_10205 [Candidatus Peribacteria bacterium]|nr:MAG: hypothetical protein H6765_10205 [Candidatus Peribacteria bacterium]